MSSRRRPIDPTAVQPGPPSGHASRRPCRFPLSRSRAQRQPLSQWPRRSPRPSLALRTDSLARLVVAAGMQAKSGETAFFAARSLHLVLPPGTGLGGKEVSGLFARAPLPVSPHGRVRPNRRRLDTPAAARRRARTRPRHRARTTRARPTKAPTGAAQHGEPPSRASRTASEFVGRSRRLPDVMKSARKHPRAITCRVPAALCVGTTAGFKARRAGAWCFWRRAERVLELASARGDGGRDARRGREGTWTHRWHIKARDWRADRTIAA